MQTIAGHDFTTTPSRCAPVPYYAGAFTDDFKGVNLASPWNIRQGHRSAVETPIVWRWRVPRFRRGGTPGLAAAHALRGPVYYLISSPRPVPTWRASTGYVSASRPTGRRDRRVPAHAPAGFGVEVKRRIMLGTFALSAGYYDAYYLRAQKVRALLRQDFDRAFAQVDTLVAPICPTPAFKLGEKIADPLTMYLSDIHVVAINPAASPRSRCRAASPDDITASRGDADRRPLRRGHLFLIGHAYQQATDWHLARPTS